MTLIDRLMLKQQHKILFLTGDRVIDIATDIGEPAITAAKKIVEYWNVANSKDLLIDISNLMPCNTTMMRITTTATTQ